MEFSKASGVCAEFRKGTVAERSRRHARWIPCLVALLLVCFPATAAQPAPGMMLATPAPEAIDAADYWISEKLDGVRARWNGRSLTTRGGATIASPPWYTRGWPGQPLDGELWLGRGRFDATSALVRSQAPADPRWREMKFMVFDLPADPGPFSARLTRLRGLVAGAGVTWLRAVPQFRVSDTAQLRMRLREVVAGGGEGLMLHHPDARYMAGRNPLLHKLKPFDDAEARVIGYVPGKGKYQGKMGALWLQRPDGRRFRLGTGFTDAMRARPPPLGSLVTYRYSGTTGHGLPRFARFLRVRDEEPPPSAKPAPAQRQARPQERL